MKAVILLLLCFVACSSATIKIFNQNSGFSLACCGAKSYDTTTQFCCIDTIFSNDDSGNNQNICCGNRRLSNDQQCCQASVDGVSVNDKAVSSSLTCCGTTGYDSTTKICCGNNVFSNNNGALECCGNTRTFNPSTDLCCTTTTVKSASCSDAVLNVNNNVIVNGQTNGLQCCGSTSFNPNTQLCCPDVTETDARAISQNSAGALECCGQQTFDSSSQTCCSAIETEEFTIAGETVTITTTTGQVTSGASLSCCDGSTRAFDSTKQICCSGTISSQNSAGSLQCCGSRTYDSNSQTCCSREVESLKKVQGCCGACDTYTTVTTTEFNLGAPANGQCCDNKPYDSTSKLCCPGDDVPGSVLNSQNSDNDRQCCGTTTYDTSNDVCCTDDTLSVGKVFTNKANSNNDISYQCCISSQTTTCGISFTFDIYDSNKQSCPCGKVINIDDDISQNNIDPNTVAGCCGTTQYDTVAKTCCPSGLFDVDPAIGLQCCSDDGKTLYNPGYQVCCGSTKSTPCTVPCGAKTIRDVEDVEQVEEIEQVEAKETKKKSSTKKSSSSKKDKKSKTKVQCGDHCCDGVGYFAAFQLCCGNKVVDFNSVIGNTSPMACCGDTLYNTLFDVCCVETTVKSSNSCGLTVSTDTEVYDASTQICCGSGVISGL